MSNREIFIDKLRQLSKEEMLERYIALLNTEKLTDYVADLEAKLAEYKQSLKETIDHYEKYCSEIHHQNIMLYAAACNAQQSNQNKISFVLERLEKVKEIALKDFDLDKGNISLARVLEEIDNQIKQLKETT